MKHVIAVLIAVLALALVQSASAATLTIPKPELRIHGNLGIAWYDTWRDSSSPAFAELRPQYVGSLYLGSKYSKGLTLGGSLYLDVKHADKARAGSLGIYYEF